MSKIRIITDSTSDITTIHRDDLTILPTTVSFGEENYRDGIDIDHETFFHKLIESDELPKTSLISPEAFYEAFRESAARGEEMIVITVSSKLSGTFQSAFIAAQDFPGVHLVDSLNVTVGLQILVIYALRLVDEGRGTEEIVAELERMKGKIHVLGLLDTLEYLKRGGRINAATAILGGALNIKPVVTVQNGVVEMAGKARGSRNGSNFVVKEVEKAGGVDFSMPYLLAYSGLNDIVLRKYVEDSRRLWAEHAEILPVATIGACIGTHVGPGAVAVAFFEKGQ